MFLTPNWPEMGSALRYERAEDRVAASPDYSTRINAR
jgi:hypothetical protein